MQTNLPTAPRPSVSPVSYPSIRLRDHSLNLADGPLIMGILNVTPDSLSDGGRVLDPAKAEEHAMRLEAQGAAIIDIGGESSRPGADPLSVEEECRRLLPVLKRVVRQLKVPVSVDTYKYDVIEKVLDMGVSLINDIYGLSYDAGNAKLICSYGAAVVLMHMRGNPRIMQRDVEYSNLLGEVEAHLAESCKVALEAGIGRDQILIDPGIGFGKSPEGNCALISNLDRLKDHLGYPVCVGLSNKSFLRKILGPSLKDLRVANAVGHVHALLKGADILRVHDVEETKQILCLNKKISRACSYD